MKKYFCLTLILALTQMGSASGENVDSSEWGTVSCAAQMSCRVPSGDGHIKAGRPLKLSIRIKNVSQGAVYLIEKDPIRDFAFVLTSPSGKVLSPRVPPVKEGEEEYRRKIITLKSNDIQEYQVDINHIYGLKEVGPYKIIAKRKILQPGGKLCEVTSNALSFILAN